MDETIRFVKTKRRCIAPNLGFLMQLRDFEKSILNVEPSSQQDEAT
jgi:hypothetical protein